MCYGRWGREGNEAYPDNMPKWLEPWRLPSDPTHWGSDAIPHCRDPWDPRKGKESDWDGPYVEPTMNCLINAQLESQSVEAGLDRYFTHFSGENLKDKLKEFCVEINPDSKISRTAIRVQNKLLAS